MCVDLKLFDHIQLNSRLHTNFACDYSEDGKISLLTENGVYVLTLKGYMENIFPRFSFKKDLVKLSDTSITEHLDINLESFIKELPRELYYEAALDVGLSGNLLNTSKVTAKPVCAIWSPRGIVEKTEGALAVLTTLNNIEIYVEVIDENEITNYVRIANFSRDISEYYRKLSWSKLDGVSAVNKYTELKRRANFITPTAFTWSHVILKDRRACCILFVGHRNGSITAWRLMERQANEIHESKLEFLERYDTNLKKITSLHWFCRQSDAGGLSVGDFEGKICAVNVSKLSTERIKFSDEVLFSRQSDLKVDKIMIISHQNKTYLIAVKQCYVLVYAINEYGEVFKGKIIQVGNLYITGILHYEKNILLVLSVCGQLKQLELSIINGELVFDEKLINLNIDTNKYRTHGIVISPNKVFLGILAYPCRLKDVSKGKGFVHFMVLANTLKNPLQTLLSINENSLRDYWDCFETMRVTCFQEKKFPWKGVDLNFNYDTLPLIKLKILRWVAKISEKIYPCILHIEEYNIKSYVLLNYMVDIKLAVQRMTKLLNIYFDEKKLTLFQMRSLDLLNFFLKEMVSKDILTKANLGETFVDEIYEVMRVANELEYPPTPQCIWCGEKIIGSSCVPFHLDIRCSMSLMPITITPGYKCPFCKCVVSREMDREYYPIFCPYCDIPMKRRSFDKKIKKCSEEIVEPSKPIYANLPQEVVISDCYSDCLKTDDDKLNEIDNNSVSYVVLTDSEDENEETMAELYNRIKSVVLHNSKEKEDENQENILNESIGSENTVLEQAESEQEQDFNMEMEEFNNEIDNGDE